MNSRGQSALEYLMTYGWALIVIAVVIGVLIFVTGGSTGGVTCQSRGTQLVLRESSINIGVDGVGMVLQNSTGGTIAPLAASSVESVSGFQRETQVPPVIPASVLAGSNLVISGLSGPVARGNIRDGTVNIRFNTAGGLDSNVSVVCNGTL